MTAIFVYIGVSFALSFVTGQSRKALHHLTYLLTKSKHIGISVYSLLYFPGTLLHEVSHFLFAAFLGVRTGEITLFPQIDDEENKVRLGSVQVAKTDFFRSSLIGAAPFITGTIALIFITSTLGWLDITSINQIFSTLQSSYQQTYFWFKIYAMLAISNTLFTSKEDRRHWPVFIAMLIIISIVMYFLSVQINTPVSISQRTTQVFYSASIAFLFSIIVNVVLLLCIKLITAIMQKVTRTRIVYR